MTRVIQRTSCASAIGNKTLQTAKSIAVQVTALFTLAVAVGLGSNATAQTINALNFVSQGSSGTDASPWPGSAISAAINSVSAAGQTVRVPAGVWLIDKPIIVTKSDITITGDQNKTILRFTGPGRLWLDGGEGGSPVDLQSIIVSGFKMDTEAVSYELLAPIHVKNCHGCIVSSNTFGDRPNINIAVLMVEGGSYNIVEKNSFAGSYVQINPLGNTPNSGMQIRNNRMDCSGVLAIGQNNMRISRNNLYNSFSDCPLIIKVTSPNRGTSSNILIDYNTLDGLSLAGKPNFAMISGFPQEDDMHGTINYFFVRNNTLRGTTSYINAQAAASGPLLEQCIAACVGINDTYDFKVTGNSLHSIWNGSIIDLRGGTYGIVNGATVSGNTFSSTAANAKHVVLRDDHTYSVVIGQNYSDQAIVY